MRDIISSAKSVMLLTTFFCCFMLFFLFFFVLVFFWFFGCLSAIALPCAVGSLFILILYCSISYLCLLNGTQISKRGLLFFSKQFSNLKTVMWLVMICLFPALERVT